MLSAFTNYVERNSNKTLLHLAVEEGKDDILEMLLPHARLMLSTKDTDGNTSLHIAAERGMDVASERLLNRYG